MPNPVLESLRQQVETTVGVIQSAIVFINGVTGRIEAAVAAALANGATEAELAPVQAEVDALRDHTQAMADAIAANS